MAMLVTQGTALGALPALEPLSGEMGKAGTQCLLEEPEYLIEGRGYEGRHIFPFFAETLPHVLDPNGAFLLSHGPPRKSPCLPWRIRRT
jgi:hypothetical protein